MFTVLLLQTLKHAILSLSLFYWTGNLPLSSPSLTQFYFADSNPSVDLDWNRVAGSPGHRVKNTTRFHVWCWGGLGLVVWLYYFKNQSAARVQLFACALIESSHLTNQPKVIICTRTTAIKWYLTSVSVSSPFTALSNNMSPYTHVLLS